MKTSSKLKASIFVLVTTLIVGSCVAIALTNTSQKECDLLTVSIDGEEFADYYTANENDDFVVHDVLMRRNNNFLQGLYYDSNKGKFVESAGNYGDSKVQWLNQDVNDQRILEPDFSTEYDLDASFFGEGLSPRSTEEFVVLTWKERKVLIFDRNNLELKDEYEFTLPEAVKEGWGVTANESSEQDNGNYRLYISDGTSKIYEINGDTLEIINTITVKDADGNEQAKINELEFVDGYIYANVWYVDKLLKIDPSTGTIVKDWDISSLAAAEKSFQNDQKGWSQADCLNGIAYDKDTEKFYLSGKKHYLIFEVTLN